MIRILNFFQITFLLIFTGLCGVVGTLIMVISRSADWTLTWIPFIWSRTVFWVCRTTVECYGEENIPKEGYHIYNANHESSLDIAAVCRIIPYPLYFIVKKELAKAPVLGFYIRAAQMIFVDRKNRESALQSMKEAARLIKGGKNVIAFPEGTRSKTGELLMFKRGSFIIAKEGNVGVVPIAIVGTRDCNPADTFRINKGKVLIKVGKTIYPEAYPELTVEELAELTRQRVDEMRTELRAKI